MDARASRYPEVYARWQRDPLAFWAEAAAAIDWVEKPKSVFDPEAGIYGRWFPGAVSNTCFNAVDRHVHAGRGEQAAIIYDSPLAGQKRAITYHRLLTETQVLGGMLRDLGVERVRLLTNNPQKIAGLEAYGITVVARAPLEVEPHAGNIDYLRTKQAKLGHLLSGLPR